MGPQEALAEQTIWAGRNIAYNLQFIPADRLDWKPAPAAKSVLEIVNHSLDCLRSMAPVLRGAAWEEPRCQPAKDLATAQAFILHAAEEYAAALKAIPPAELERRVELPHGTMSLKECSSYEVIDLIHHHGQIVYIQTLLGDTRSHFFDEG